MTAGGRRQKIYSWRVPISSYGKGHLLPVGPASKGTGLVETLCQPGLVINHALAKPMIGEDPCRNCARIAKSDTTIEVR